jgi:hypothetical protein
MTMTTATPTLSGTTTKQKVGLVICALYSLGNIPSAAFSTPDGEVSSILGVVGLVAAIMAWRGNRVALRVAAGAIIVITLTGLPAFFVDVPMGIKALVGFSVVVTVAAIVLMFSGDRRLASITD